MRHNQLLSGRIAWTALTLLACCSSATAQDRRLTIRPVVPVPAETPVALAAPAGLRPGLYTMKPESDSPSIDAVVVESGGTSSFIFIAPAITEPTSFLVSLSTRAPESSEGVAFTPEGPNLKVAIDGAPLTIHRVDGPYKPFLFPLLGPNGEKMTRSFPMEKVSGDDVDHPHHESFWFTHGLVNGIDFWTVKKGTIKETARTIEESGPVLGRLRTRDDWIGPEGAKVCEDERVLTVYRTKAMRVLDYDVTLKASAGPIDLGETKEGSFGLRVASSMDVDKKTGGKIVNAEGLKDAAAWGKPSRWVDYTGPVDGKTMGIAILDSPASFRHPTTWHVRTYGLFAANPFGGKEFGVPGYGDHKLAQGDSIRFSYRVILHAGGTDTSDLERRFAHYAKPPEASWTQPD